MTDKLLTVEEALRGLNDALQRYDDADIPTLVRTLRKDDVVEAARKLAAQLVSNPYKLNAKAPIE